MRDVKNVFGVTIDMSQWEPYALTKEAKLKGEWNYELFGHFDEMRLCIKHDLRAFWEQDSKILRNLNNVDRIHYHPETHKVFLYVTDDNHKTNETILMKYAKGESDRTFIALIAIKLRSQLFNPRGCNPCDCIKNFLEEFHRKEDIQKVDPNFEYCIMNSLSIDEIYVLIGADSPNSILNFTYCMQFLECNFTCKESNIGQQNALNAIKIRLNDLKTRLDDLKKSNMVIEAEYKKLQYSVNKCIDAISNGILGEFKYENLTNSAKYLQECLDDYYKDFEDKSASYELMKWLRDCINAVRSCGTVPIILQTHTSIGIRRNCKYEDCQYFKENQKDEKVLFEMKMQSRSGADLISTFGKDFNEYVGYTESKENETSQILPLCMVLGRHDYLWQGELELTKLISMYYKTFLNREMQAPDFAIRYSSGHFILNPETVETDNSNQEVIKFRQKILNEDSRLSNLWVKEQHKFAADLFKRIRRQAKDFPFLEPLIDEIDNLHMQGCRRFFYALTLREFEDASKFFITFYIKIEKMFKLLEQVNQNEKTEYARMIAKGLEISFEALSGLFHDRMILLDMSIYENTRPSLYTTGAYERLLKRYSDWIKDIRDLLIEIEGREWPNDLLYYLLVPVKHDTIHSYNPFPISNDEHTMVIYYTTLNRMLDIPCALPMFVHEVGHYLGIVGRESRIKTYLCMVAYFYSIRLTRDLCEHSHSSVPSILIREYTEQLAIKLKDYFILCCEKLKDSDEVNLRGCRYLDYAEKLCIDWYNNLLRKEIFNPSPDAKEFVQEFVNLYNILNCPSLLKEKGLLFEALSDNVADEMVIKGCKTHIKECYADLIMIQVLEMDTADYFRVLLTAFQKRDNQEIAAGVSAKLGEPGSQTMMDAVRAISALLQTESMDISEDDTKTWISIGEKTRNKMNATINKVNAMVNKSQNQHLCEKWNSLRTAMEVITRQDKDFNDYYDYVHGWLCIWRLATPYLYKSGQEIKSKLCELKRNQGKSSDNLKAIQNLYSTILELDNDDMQTKDTMQQLFVLLES